MIRPGRSDSGSRNGQEVPQAVVHTGLYAALRGWPLYEEAALLKPLEFLVEVSPGVRTIEIADAQAGNIFRFRHIAVYRHPRMPLRVKALPMRRASADFARDEGEGFVAPDVADYSVRNVRHGNPVNIIVSPESSGAEAISAIAAGQPLRGRKKLKSNGTTMARTANHLR